MGMSSEMKKQGRVYRSAALVGFMVTVLIASAAAQEIRRDGSARKTDPQVVSEAGSLIWQSGYANWRASLSADYPQLEDYRRVLLRWVVGAEEYWVPDAAHPELGACRMKSTHVHVCTARSLPIYAALAADTKCEDPVWTREKLSVRINAAIAFLCTTYDPNGPHEGYWGKKPGKNSLRYETWIIGNMLDVLQMAPEIVTAENGRHIREILIDIIEDERISGRAQSLADYRHEGIIWTMNLLARGAILYADHPRAAEWLDLAKYGYASALSVPADQEDKTVLDGKPIKEWVARRPGVFHSDFTLDHHALGIHPGYMCMAAHREAALYDMMKRSGMKISPVWYNHYRDVMNVIKDLSLWDGRVAYPNGKDWADYLYGVSAMRYQMVAMQMMFGDPEARLIEQGLFRQLEWLQLKRGKGDFGPSNAEYVFNVNDAKNIAFPYFFHQVYGFVHPVTQADLDRAHTKVHYSPEGKFVYVRDPQRFASWGWQACCDRRLGEQRSTGLIIPNGNGLGSHLAQWDDNLVPVYTVSGQTGQRIRLYRRPPTIRVETFTGGFAVSERNELCMPGAEAQKTQVASVVDHRMMVAVPDGRTVFVAVAGRAIGPLIQLDTADLNWRFLRTVFSDTRRTIFYEGGWEESEHVNAVNTGWLNVDGVLGLVSIGRPACGSCKLSNDSVSLRVCSLPQCDFEPGQEIFTSCVAFVTDVDAAQTRVLAGNYREEKVGRDVRIYRFRGLDDQDYAVVVNFTDREINVDIADWAPAHLLTPGAVLLVEKTGSTLRMRIARHSCVLLTL